jgi:hypothetical protein
MRLDKNNDTNEVLEDDVVETTKTSPEQKVTISDAKILLNSGKMGLIFIGVVVSFFVLALFLTFVHMPTWFYIVIGVIAAPLLLFYYLKIHENDEDKLD